MYIKDIFHSNTGVSQYRLEESTSKDAVLYTLYGQNELYEDLTGVPGAMSDRKQIRTEYKGSTLKAGDLIQYLALLPSLPVIMKVIFLLKTMFGWSR